MFFGEPKKLFQAFIWKSIELDLIFCHCTQEKWGNMVSGSSLGKQECKSAIESRHRTVHRSRHLFSCNSLVVIGSVHGPHIAQSNYSSGRYIIVCYGFPISSQMLICMWRAYLECLVKTQTVKTKSIGEEADPLRTPDSEAGWTVLIH